MKKCVFLDRDGTINIGFNINNPDELELYPFVSEAINKLNNIDYLVVVATNQGGVSLGFMDDKDLKKIHDNMIKTLKEENAHIDKIYSSFYHKHGKTEKYKTNPHWRKPEPGMLVDASKDLNIDLKNSYMIGDRAGDIEAGNSAGCKSILVLTGSGRETEQELKNKKIKVDYICNDLLEAAKLIEEMDRV